MSSGDGDSVLEKLLKRFRKDDTSQLREALSRMREQRIRDETRRRRTSADLEELSRAEEELSSELESPDIDVKRAEVLASRIKEIRQKETELLERIESIYNPRLERSTQIISYLERELEKAAEPTIEIAEEKYRESRRISENGEYFVGPRNGCDLVVFVHGLIGDYYRSWYPFARTLSRDKTFEKCDILLWGYPTSLVTPVPAPSIIGQRLITDLRLHHQVHPHIFLVGHSLGGIIILDAVTQALRNGLARAEHIGKLAHILLYGTPFHGSLIADVAQTLSKAANLAGVPAWLNQQVDSLAAGEYLQELLNDFNLRVYKPEIRPGDENAKLAIPFSVVAGESDIIVTRASAEGVFRGSEPYVVAGNHLTMKEPHHVGDSRYKVLSSILQRHITSCSPVMLPQVKAESPKKGGIGDTGTWRSVLDQQSMSVFSEISAAAAEVEKGNDGQIGKGDSGGIQRGRARTVKKAARPADARRKRNK